jgi:pyrroline-5-carboxylate reductase
MKASLTNKCIGFIGVGVMGSSLIKSLLTSSINSEQICISDKSSQKAAEISSTYQVKVKSITEIGKDCDVIFLAVKPQDLDTVLSELSQSLKKETLLISIAAGKTTKFIESKLANTNPVVRVMPNTPAQIGKGVSAISPGASATNDHLSLTKDLLSASGLVVEVAEENQDAVTALSGSGPAYFFNFIEAMIKAGVNLGLTQEIATQLAIGTIAGSAAMLQESGIDAATLRKNVTSPNGTTAAALKVFSDSNLEKIVADAMAAAKKRAQELA